MIYFIMGVLGSGKTAAGRKLAEKLDCGFYDGDDYHPLKNREKMSKGIPLDDEDRKPWLHGVKGVIDGEIYMKNDAVIACSALKQKYRDYLKLNRPEIKLVYLKENRELIEKRLKNREGHFVAPSLLDSQIEALEPPENALVIDIQKNIEDIAGEILESK